MNDLRHLSRDEQKLLADVALLVKDDDQEFNYEMLKVAAPDEASGEFWFRMAEMLSTLPPNQSLDLRMTGGRLAVAVSILSVLLQESPDIPQLWAQKSDCAQLSGTRPSDTRPRFGATTGQSGRSQRGRIFGKSLVPKSTFHVEGRVGTLPRRQLVYRNAR